ncbi:hypothetical protein T02_4010 [Trichinella nativa]|uniref:Uncharacterized protein n=1 Tax=Trichinella nativa TaxID=6335 RepID=A0A0V1L116_9BILA|nr:hypothetical protein T02_4010 [Trichinella nativa]
MERHRLLRLIQHCFIVLICIICDIFVEKVSVRLSNGINFETTPGDKSSNRNVENFCPDIFLHAQPGSGQMTRNHKPCQFVLDYTYLLLGVHTISFFACNWLSRTVLMIALLRHYCKRAFLFLLAEIDEDHFQILNVSINNNSSTK